MDIEKKACPDCNGGGVYQEYDEYDRYYVHRCATCDGLGEINRLRNGRTAMNQRVED